MFYNIVAKYMPEKGVQLEGSRQLIFCREFNAGAEPVVTARSATGEALYASTCLGSTGAAISAISGFGQTQAVHIESQIEFLMWRQQ